MNNNLPRLNDYKPNAKPQKSAYGRVRERMKAPTVEILEQSVAKAIFPDRDDSCPMCGADGELEFAMIRTRGSIIGYYAGFVYHCHACGTAWPLCSVGEKTPLTDWVEFDEFYEGLE